MKLDKFTVGKRYGRALFELAVENEQTEEVYQQLKELVKILNEVPDLHKILSDDRLEPHEKRLIMDKLVEGYQGIMKNFLEVVYDYDRMDDLPFMIDEYERRYDELNGLMNGTIITAVPISEEKKAALESKTAALFGFKKAAFDAKVDPTILGGVIVEANHQIIDGSLKSRFESIRTALKNQ